MVKVDREQNKFTGNREHLNILLNAIEKEDIEIWNRWRDENKNFKIDLSGANLIDAYLGGANLKKANLSNTNLSGADLENANLYKANLRYAYGHSACLVLTNLNYADLRDAQLQRAQLIEAKIKNANLTRAILTGADLSGATLKDSDLSEARMRYAILEKANIKGAQLIGAELVQANLCQAELQNANLMHAILHQAFLNSANLNNANLHGAHMNNANLNKSKFRKANLFEADIRGCSMVRTDFREANLDNSKVYGISTWDLKVSDNTTQSNLIISDSGQQYITTDNIELAQFIHLLINNKKIRHVIDTMTGKAILILGRFGERKKVLNSIADELRKRNYIPILFDFDRPVNRDITETIKTLAGLCKFVIADLTLPKSVPHEATSIIPFLSIPFLPIIEGEENPYSMFSDYKKYPWVMKPVSYKNIKELQSMMDKQILLPAEEKHKEIKKQKAMEDWE